MNTEKKDIFQRVTDQIVKAIEEGAGSYRVPWRTSGGFPSSPINATSKRPYRGINVLVLWASAQEREYKSGTWATYKQWQELGAQVRKGEKSAIVFWKFFEREDEATEGTTEGTKSGRFPMARDYWLFNAEQVEGYAPTEEAAQSRGERIESAEAFFQAAGIKPQAGENRAFYCPETDAIHIPPFDAFKEPLFYYSVLAHESTHNADSRIMPRWTPDPPRILDDPTRLPGIITVPPGRRAASHPDDSAPAWNPEL
jgi:antirestriction protein ArdC